MQPESFTPDDVYCAYCHAPAAGTCATCSALVCADCSELVAAPARTYAVCSACAEHHQGSGAWRGWLSLLGGALAVIAALSGLLWLLSRL